MVEHVQVGRLSNSWREAVFNTVKLLLMPCAAICQNELWSRILLIISQVGKKKKSLISHVFTCLSLSYSHLSCVVFTRETNKI